MNFLPEENYLSGTRIQKDIAAQEMLHMKAVLVNKRMGLYLLGEKLKCQYMWNLCFVEYERKVSKFQNK